MSLQTDNLPFHKKEQNIYDFITSAIFKTSISEDDADIIISCIAEKGTSGNIKNYARVQITRLLIAIQKYCKA